MNLVDILNKLEVALPILGTMTGHPEIAQLAAKLLDMGEEEWEQRTTKTGRSRTEELEYAKATFAQLKAENDALRQMGHEGEA